MHVGRIITFMYHVYLDSAYRPQCKTAVVSGSRRREYRGRRLCRAILCETASTLLTHSIPFHSITSH